MASEDELQRRAEEARVREILEPTDEQDRDELRRKQKARDQDRAAAEDKRKTHRLSTLLLIALVATGVLAVLRWMLSGG